MPKLYNSEWDTNIVVAVIDEGDYQYQTMAPLFNEYGYGFVLPEQKLIFIDGSYDVVHQKWIEAHEVAHIILGHKQQKNPNDEIEADMNLRNSSAKPKTEKCRKKREELSVSASKSIKKELIEISITFD